MKYKIGDTVIVNGSFDDRHFSNAIGKVVCISAVKLYGKISIEFIQFIDGHSSKGAGAVNGKAGHCWNVSTALVKPYLTKIKLKKLLEI